MGRNLPLGVTTEGQECPYKTRDNARRDVFDYIEMLYNPKRKHARNGMLSPIEFERQQKVNNPKKTF